MPQRELRIRSAVFERSAADETRRTIPASLSSEEPVTRYGELEILRHDSASVDMLRAADGLPLLYCHDKTTPIGIVENVRLEKRRLVGTLRFGQSAKAAEVWQDVLDGVLRHISIGYVVNASETTDGGYIATNWTPFEASVLAVPADPTVGVGRGHSDASNQRNHNMPKANDDHEGDVLSREEQVEQLRESAATYGQSGLLNDLLARGLSLSAVKDGLLRQRAFDDIRSGGHLTIAPASYFETRQGTRERELITDALVARLGGPAVTRENPYRHVRIVDMVRDCLEIRGIRTTTMSPAELIDRGLHTTSDFPNLLSGAGNRVLRRAYGVAGGIKRAFRESTAVDFRAKQALNLGEAPVLEQVAEGGEFQYGTMAETRSTYALGTFGKIFGISRQALVNDDLDAFGDMIAKLGRAAAEFESNFLVSLLTSNPAMYDSVALFHASHNNLASGAGSALQLSSLSDGRKAMRLQKGLDGKTAIDASPKFLIVPATLETMANQLVAAITPTKTSDVNPFAESLEVVVDPRLDAISTTAWFLAADPAAIDTIEYSFLESAGGPEIFSQEGFEVDGVKMKVRLDFGAGAMDWRGLYKSAGV